ncbi:MULTISPECIES: response regulator [unclassified Leptolyngbya]|uniref:response regulator n=1 Tax=unclassified Leptolyngbya TaxID=2650499 RepID=UPI0016878F0A|nr:MULTISPECIES: response regulator [unclassified Leptolyngbya]MBD1911223.1 response regulator [Leptolyngbya sp. FACHB-8]MBD2155470.1 response regulator [Leptolyngbya sp. FACHB-16]
MVSDSKVNILLVDDHNENLIALEAILSGMGQNLVKAHSGEEAFRCLLKQDFAVILLDVQMPGMDGFETASLIRQRERSQHTPIIFITAFNTNDMWQMKGYSLGAVDYLLKPIDPVILVSKVTVFVELFKKTQEVERQAAELSAQKIEIIREQLARQQAEAANRLKDEFLAIVSHELRTPLNSILGWAKLLETKQFDPETTQRALEVISRNAQSQAQLVEDILDVARLMRGKLCLSRKPLDLNILVSAEIESMRVLAEAKGVQIKKQFPSSPCKVSGDIERLQQIVRNLVSNAIKFTPEGGIIEVVLSVLPNQAGSNTPLLLGPQPDQEAISAVAQITVKDNGVGIQPEFLPYIFEYFRQADSSSTRSHGGLGLGLAIVRQLVDLHNGRIEVASGGSGKGSTFTVYLPMAASVQDVTPDSPVPTYHYNSVDVPTLERVSVLVVDDNGDNRAFLIAVLEQAKAQVTAVASAQDAIDYLQDHRPDILLSDIAMPEEDGLSLIQRIRQWEQGQGYNIPAIALSAYTKQEDQREAIAAGFHHFLPKPVEPKDLIQAIGQLTTLKTLPQR